MKSKRKRRKKKKKKIHNIHIEITGNTGIFQPRGFLDYLVLT